MRIGILTSGGDAPGMNAAIRAATLVALTHGHEPIGVRRGYRGLVAGDLEPLTMADVFEALRRGGTLLQSARCPDFHEPDVRQIARDVLTDHGVDGLIVIGGNGSLTGALHLSDPDEAPGWPVRVAGIPASIDNDIALTSMSIGVDTAMNTIVEACDKIADTASAHDRVFLIEVMGRDCGYLAMTSAVAAGADMVLFPEAGRDESELVDAVVDAVRAVRDRGGVQRVMAVKAEGIELSNDELKARVDQKLAAAPNSEADGEPLEIETRVTVLGHVVRGGRPSAFDRLLGSRLGHVAVRSLIDGDNRMMAAWQPLIDAAQVGQRSPHDPYCHLMPLDTVLEATRQLLDGESALAQWRTKVFDDLRDVFLL